jgi:hypothetical protein
MSASGNAREREQNDLCPLGVRYVVAHLQGLEKKGVAHWGDAPLCHEKHRWRR